MNLFTAITNRLLSAFGLASKSFRPFGWIPMLPGEQTSLTAPMQQCTWVMRAIKLVSGPISSVPLVFSAKGSDEDYTNPMLDSFFDAPAVNMDASDVIESFTGWMKMKGEWFALFDDSWLARFPEARSQWQPFIVARPDRMREVITGGKLMGWQYMDATGMRHALLPEQVIQSKFWNPYNDWRGLSEYDAASLAAQTDYTNQNFAKNLAESNGDTGPIISAKGPGLSEAQTKQIVSQLEAKRKAQMRGEFVPAFLNGEVSVEDSKIRTPDATFQSQRSMDRDQIAVAFGIPPSMFSAQASYSIGSASDYFRLIETACQPIASKLARVYSAVASKMTGIELRARFDWDEHSTIQQVRNERIASATALWDRGMPWKTVNEYLALGMPEFEGWDTGYISFGLTPVGQVMLPDNDPAFAETVEVHDEEETDAVADAKSAIRRRQWSRLLADRKPPADDDEGCGECGCSDELPDPPDGMTPEQRSTESQKRSQWRSLMGKRRKSLKAFESRFTKLVLEARSEVLANISARGVAETAAVARAAAADFIFEWSKWSKRFVAEMRKVAAATVQIAGSQLYDELGRDDSWEMPAPETMAFLAQRENKMVGVAQDVFDRIRSSLEDGLREGESMAKLADRIRATSNEITTGRARVVAQTETAAAYGSGRHEAMKTAGIEWKRWLSSRNKSVRPTHVQADEDYTKAIPINSPFIVGGYALMHPGDASGPPQEVINCHCVSVASAAPTEE